MSPKMASVFVRVSLDRVGLRCARTSHRCWLIEANLVREEVEMASPLPCPFCGEIPEVYPKNPAEEGNAWGEVSCVNPRCVAQPSVQDGSKQADERGSAKYKQLAIRRWNRRTGPREFPALPEGK